MISIPGREVVEILADVVRNASKKCVLTITDSEHESVRIPCPDIHYVFGNSQYLKDNLDELSKSPASNEIKFPLIFLRCPVKEKRDDKDYYSCAKVDVIIACSSSKGWSNEERLVTSFRNILRPIYNGFLEALAEDSRLDFGYSEHINHEYSENYSYGRYGAYTSTGQEVSDPIDAINIINLNLKIKNPNCVRI